MWEVGLHPSPVEFSSHSQFYKLSHSWLLGMCRRSCILQPACLFTVLWGISPPPLFSAQGTPSSLLHVYFVIAYYSVSLFSLCGGWSVQGAMLIWPRVVCGNTVCCLAHFVIHVFPSSLGTGIWPQHGSPPGFSVYVKWGCYAWAGGVGEWKFCLLVFFPVRSISSISPRFYFRKHAFCFLPLAAILESSPLFFFFWSKPEC
jgi:hypothetical protein